jgi:NAD(P)-dependent dehydrogenase (short-subunit alcohol dehydrogenase family)
MRPTFQEATMDFRDRHVVVTGGTGALGIAVAGALLEAGATCHVPYRSEAEAEHFPHRGNARVTLTALGDLSDEAAVTRFYEGLSLWASIHIAGTFAFAPIGESGKSVLMGQLESNLVSTYLCCRAALAAFARSGQGGRIVNVASRQGVEPRQGANLTAYTAAKAGVAALTMALAEEVAGDGILVNAVAPVANGYAGQPQVDAEGGFFDLAQGRGGRGHHRVPRLPRQQGHARRRRAGVREGVILAQSRSFFPLPALAGRGCRAPKARGG